FADYDKLSAGKAEPSPAPPPPASSAGYAAAPEPPSTEEARALAKKREFAKEKNLAFDSAPVEAQTIVVTGEAAGRASRVMQTSGQRVLPVPGSNIIWKIDPDGRARRTTDLGESWRTQDTGVNATLFSGSAPSEKVCWLVGTFGTVLLTTDSGVHWTKVTAP